MVMRWVLMKDEMGVNEGEEDEADEYGCQISPSYFNLAMEDCSRKARGGLNSIAPA